MPFLIEHIIGFVITVLVGVLLATGLFVALALRRRQQRDRYFLHLDDVRQKVRPVLAALLDATLDYQEGLIQLQRVRDQDGPAVLEHLLLERRPTPPQLPLLRQLCEDLGLVRLWQQQLTGSPDTTPTGRLQALAQAPWSRLYRLSFLVRAKSAENLGIIHHQPSWPLLVKALADPHPDVQEVALRSLASIQEPESFPALMERLHAVVLNPTVRLALRSVKSALVGFPLRQAAGLLGSLQHTHPRIRFLATDIIREMVEREAAPNPEFILGPASFSPELMELFSAQLCFDPNPDVRARAAPVIAYLSDSRAITVLLTLLDDPEWFVRLHTVRALGKRRFLPQLAPLARRLIDSHWMVRQATVHTLVGFEFAGIRQLTEHFLSTQDRYSREQIADEWQRTGFIPTLLQQYGQEGAEREHHIIEQLVHLGVTSYLLAAVAGGRDLKLRKKFVRDFGRQPDPQIQAWLAYLISYEPDPELRALAQAAAQAAQAGRAARN